MSIGNIFLGAGNTSRGVRQQTIDDVLDAAELVDDSLSVHEHSVGVGVRLVKGRNFAVDIYQWLAREFRRESAQSVCGLFKLPLSLSPARFYFIQRKRRLTLANCFCR